MLHLLQFRAFVFTFLCLCFLSTHWLMFDFIWHFFSSLVVVLVLVIVVVFLRCGSLNVLFLFKWKFDKETSLQVEHANKYSVFPFFRVPSGRLFWCCFFFALARKFDALCSPLCTGTHWTRNAHHKTEFVFIGIFFSLILSAYWNKKKSTKKKNNSS